VKEKLLKEASKLKRNIISSPVTFEELNQQLKTKKRRLGNGPIKV
jgi:hypothetical protein